MKSNDVLIIMAAIGGVVVLFCGLFGVLLVINGIAGPRSEASKDNETLRDAWVECKLEVMNRLKNPDSADFPYTADVRGTRQPDGTITIRSYVDATNGFGAVVRTPFVCEAKKVGITYITSVDLLE